MAVPKFLKTVFSIFHFCKKKIHHFQEAEPSGKYIVLENISRRDENIGDWKLRRKIAGKREIVFTFPREFTLRAQKSVKIFARGQGVHSPPDSLVYDLEDSFGTGNDVVTTLYNKEGEVSVNKLCALELTGNVIYLVSGPCFPQPTCFTHLIASTN